MTVSGDLTVDVVPVTSDFNPVPDRPPLPVEVPPAPRPPTPAAAPRPPAPTAPTWLPSENDLAAAAAESAAGPATGLSADERLAVLEAVERGEIDVEEALRRLEASDANTTHGNV